MRDTLSRVRDALRTLKEQAEVLPAVGGARNPCHTPSDTRATSDRPAYSNNSNNRADTHTTHPPPTKCLKASPYAATQKRIGTGRVVSVAFGSKRFRSSSRFYQP